MLNFLSIIFAISMTNSVITSYVILVNKISSCYYVTRTSLKVSQGMSH
jgi:hypothetical protein